MGVSIHRRTLVQVEEAMQRLRDEGRVTSCTDVESTAMRAYAEASGMPLEAALDSTEAEPRSWTGRLLRNLQVPVAREGDPLAVR